MGRAAGKRTTKYAACVLGAVEDRIRRTHLLGGGSM